MRQTNEHFITPSSTTPGASNTVKVTMAVVMGPSGAFDGDRLQGQKLDTKVIIRGVPKEGEKDCWHILVQALEYQCMMMGMKDPKIESRPRHNEIVYPNSQVQWTCRDKSREGKEYMVDAIVETANIEREEHE